MDNDFLIAYKQNIKICLKNNHKDNWDKHRFGTEKSRSRNGFLQLIKQALKYVLAIAGLYDPTKPAMGILQNNVNQFQWVYQTLADNKSKQLMIQVLSFHALGHRQ